MLRYGIPEFRLPKSILNKLKEKLIEMGVKIRPNILIGSVITVDDMFRDGYKAVFIGTGVWKPRPLHIKGETFGNVHYAIDYLKNPQSYDLGRRVCVIGAGNTAMDVSRTAIRNGSKEVYVMYRKGIENVSARENEIEYAKIDGVRFEFYKSPVEITDDGVKFVRTEKVKDSEGKEKFVIVNGSEDLLKVDSVIIAAGQGPRSTIVSNTNGIKINDTGLIMVDEFGRTEKEGVFASGDVVTGAKTVVEAVRCSKKVALAIDEYVKNLK